MADDLGNAGTPEERRTGLGGSDAAAALGISPWQTPYELWEQKTGLAPAIEPTEPMLWGALLEDIIRREYAKRTGLRVRPVKDMLRHAEHPWMFAHVDGLVGDNDEVPAILEVKTARTSQGWGEPDTDEIPLPYLVQVHHYMAVTGAEFCDVAVLIGGSDFRVYQVRRDREIQHQVIESEAAFWESVTKGVPPDPITLEDAVRRWGRLDAEGTVTACLADIEAVQTLRRIHQEKRALEALEEQAKLVLMTAMGDDGLNLIHPNGELLATWKLDNGRKAYSVAARAPSRRFLVKHLEEA